MNITDIQQCAVFFQKNYLKTFYFVITYHGKSFILIGEKSNFPHLMGIQNQIYHSNGYRRPQKLFNDILHVMPSAQQLYHITFPPHLKCKLH